MKKNYVTRVYDPYDGYTFDYRVFPDKASAKSYARHWRVPYNFGASVWETTVHAPLGMRITREHPVFALLERDGFELED